MKWQVKIRAAGKVHTFEREAHNEQVAETDALAEAWDKTNVPPERLTVVSVKEVPTFAPTPLSDSHTWYEPLRHAHALISSGREPEKAIMAAIQKFKPEGDRARFIWWARTAMRLPVDGPQPAEQS